MIITSVTINRFVQAEICCTLKEYSIHYMKKQNSKQNASTTGDFKVVIPQYNFRGPVKKFGANFEIETHVIQYNESKNKKL